MIYWAKWSVKSKVRCRIRITMMHLILMFIKMQRKVFNRMLVKGSSRWRRSRGIRLGCLAGRVRSMWRIMKSRCLIRRVLLPTQWPIQSSPKTKPVPHLQPALNFNTMSNSKQWIEPTKANLEKRVKPLTKNKTETPFQ